MNQSVPCLHPHPGWDELAPLKVPSQGMTNKKNIVGKHCILELYECDQLRIDDEAFVRTVITSAAKFAGAQLLNLITHHFEPQGVTGLALLAESHISIHTWPEHGYAAIDIFTCGDHTMPEKACTFIRKEFFSQRYFLKSFDRQTSISKA